MATDHQKEGILESLDGTILRHNDGKYQFGPGSEVKRPALMNDQNRITLNIMNEEPFLPIVLDEHMPAPCQEWLQSSGLANSALKIRAIGKMPQYMVEQLTEQASLVDVMGIVKYLHFEGDHVLRPNEANHYISQFVHVVKQGGTAQPKLRHQDPGTHQHERTADELVALPLRGNPRLRLENLTRH